MIIDWQHHFLPEQIYESGGSRQGQAAYQNGKAKVHLYDGRETVRLPEEIYRLDKHLEFMDAAGIDIAVLSYTAVTSLEDCMLINDAYGNIMSQYPDRFTGLSPCIPTIGSEALDELERAVNVVGLKGIVITPQIAGMPLDSDKIWPFYDIVSRLKVPVFVHPTPLSLITGYNAFNAKYDLYQTLVREFDLANATARIILGGVLTQFPDLRFVISHMGGAISAIMERILQVLNSKGFAFWTEITDPPPLNEPLGENFIKLFDKLCFDMAGFEGGMNAVKCSLTTINPDRLLFATDYPFTFRNKSDEVRIYIENIKNLGLPPLTVERILGGNAAMLLHM